MNLIAEKYSDDRCCFSFWVVIFLDKEVKCSDPYTHECLGASDAALVSFLFCHLATCISRFAAANSLHKQYSWLIIGYIPSIRQQLSVG